MTTRTRKQIALNAALLLLLLLIRASAQDTLYPPDGHILPGPPRPSEFSAWSTELQNWRREKLIRMGYDGAEYARAELLWQQRDFIQTQVMVEDRYLYDPAARRFTVDRFLADLNNRYGGVDSVLLWPVYPNIGIDNRNQYDLHDDLPGGRKGLRNLIEDFHRHGVKVFLPAMPWDNGTRETGVPHWEAAAKLAAETGADGINGDTFFGMPRAYKSAADRIGHPVALEPEQLMESDEQLAWNTQSWGYWKYPWIPPVSRYKWLEPRHMVNVCDRWARDKTNHLQAAFFNGVGFVSWENIWGIWNGITPRDGESIRRIAAIERHFAPLLVSRDWEPHTPTLQHGIFASRFPGAAGTLITLVNRNPYDVAGQQLAITAVPGMRYFDPYHGVELRAEVQDGRVWLTFTMEAQAFGAVFITPTVSPELNVFLEAMKQMTARPLSSFSRQWRSLPQMLIAVEPAKAAAPDPENYVKIPAGRFEFRVSGIMLEGSNEEGVDVQYPWESSARRHHRRLMDVPAFLLMRNLVTNEQFRAFLAATGYAPADAHNFLRDWKDGRYPDGWGNKPVTWVSIEDARAYAKWAGARLPHEWEWQYAAQGADGRLYPWGNQFDPQAVPPKETGRTLRAPSDVAAFSKGASPFGVMDMVGNVWQWTDEYVDDHTRAAILRGGSYYWPQGSEWYFPNTYKLNEHGKYLLMSPSKDRSAMIGFRCARDL